MLKVFQAFHTLRIRIVLYIVCSGQIMGPLTAYILILLYPELMGQNTRYTELCAQYVQYVKLE